LTLFFELGAFSKNLVSVETSLLLRQTEDLLFSTLNTVCLRCLWYEDSEVQSGGVERRRFGTSGWKNNSLRLDENVYADSGREEAGMGVRKRGKCGGARRITRRKTIHQSTPDPPAEYHKSNIIVMSHHQSAVVSCSPG
jgi:hypothetical protein